MWNIPVEETIDIRTNILFENTERTEELLKKRIEGTFVSCCEFYLIFNGKLYKQVNRVIWGSPLGPTLTNALL